MDTKILVPDGMRGPYGLHQTHGLEIMDKLRDHGSIYLGPAFSDRPFTFATQAFPEVCYFSDGQGTVRGHDNACSHYKHSLIMGDRLDKLNRKRSGGVTVCPFHAVTFDLESGACKGLGRAKLPEGFDMAALDLERQDLFVQNGFVFRLGDKAQTKALEAVLGGFDLVESVFPGLFSINGRNERISGKQFIAKSYPQNADALTSVVNFLDILHVPFIHPNSLGRVCSIDGYRHRANEHAIVQWVPLNERFRNDSASTYSTAFWDSLGENSLLTCPDTGKTVGAVWVTFRKTGLMLEWYPGVIVISQCFPGWVHKPGHENDWRRSTFFHHFYYEDFAGEQLIAGHQELFEETGDEDEVRCTGTSNTIFQQIARGKEMSPFGFACAQFEDYATMFYRDVARMLYG